MLFDVLSIRCTRTHYVVVFDDAANFVASCGKVPLHESKWWIIISCKNVIGWCRDMKEKADDLETFRERFRRLCWLDGPNRSISMLYLRLFDVRWFLKTQCYVCVFCFPITISVTYSCVLEFYFEKRLTILFLVLGLVTWVVFAGWSWYWMVYMYREC